MDLRFLSGGGDLVGNASANGVSDDSSNPAAGAAAVGAGAEAGPPRIAQWRRSGASLLARRSGTLGIAGGCVVLVGLEGSTTLPIFPSGGASWSTDGSALALKGKSYAVGDQIELFGGVISAEEAERRG